MRRQKVARIRGNAASKSEGKHKNERRRRTQPIRSNGICQGYGDRCNSGSSVAKSGEDEARMRWRSRCRPGTGGGWRRRRYQKGRLRRLSRAGKTKNAEGPMQKKKNHAVGGGSERNWKDEAREEGRERAAGMGCSRKRGGRPGQGTKTAYLRLRLVYASACNSKGVERIGESN